VAGFAGVSVVVVVLWDIEVGIVFVVVGRPGDE
jgi:hypothetical protein